MDEDLPLYNVGDAKQIRLLACCCDGDSLSVDERFGHMMVGKVWFCFVKSEAQFQRVRAEVMRHQVFQATRGRITLVLENRISRWKLEREQFIFSIQC